MQLALKIASVLADNGLEPQKAHYVAVVITEESIWKLKKYGIDAEGEPDKESIF